MATLNRVFLVGRLTFDPELRQTPNGLAVASLRLAVDDSYTDKSGKRVDRAVFVDVEVWDKQAERCNQYLHKGSPVLVEGRLQMDQWEDKKTHEKRSRLRIRADRVQFLERGPAGTARPPEGDAPEDFAPSPAGSERSRKASGEGKTSQDLSVDTLPNDDDLPF